jgi:hypothetical protein
MIHYLSNLSRGKIILWCYLIWYLVIAYFYFDPEIHIWLNSAGISVVIGIALMLSVSSNNGLKPDKWQVFRLFAMPFCVSSFSSLIKGHGFILIVPPTPSEQVTVVGACATFILIVLGIKNLTNKQTEKHHSGK